MHPIGNILFLNTGGGVSTNADVATYIMYKNLLPTATVLEGGNISALHDNLTNIFYKGLSGITVIEVQLPSAKTINCFTLAGANLFSATINISFYLWDANTLQYDLIVTATSGRDNQPVMVVFENQISSKVKIEINAGAPFQIGELAFGECLKMPVTPSVGFQPARWDTKDEITHHVSEYNNFGRSTINTRGNSEVLPFNMIPHTFMRDVWAYFIDEAKGLPIWVAWNQQKYPAECIYGKWSQDKPAYKSPLFSGFTLTVDGNA